MLSMWLICLLSMLSVSEGCGGIWTPNATDPDLGIHRLCDMEALSNATTPTNISPETEYLK